MLDDETWFPCEWCGQPLSVDDDVEADIPDGSRVHVHRTCVPQPFLQWRVVSELDPQALGG
jgi:hypothetical protein